MKLIEILDGLDEYYLFHSKLKIGEKYEYYNDRK